MSNINRDYLIVLNPKTSKVTVPELNYYIYDKYTANLFVNLVTTEAGKVVNLPDADQYKLVLHVLKPTNEIQDVENIQVFNKEKALFQIELDHELTKNIGRYKCELLTIDKTDHIVQSAKFSYRVKKSIYNDLDVVTETPQYPIIINLLNKLQDIDKYEEERRANEVARVAAEKARVKDYTDLRQTVTTDIETMQEKIDSFDGKVQEVDNAVQQMRTNITDYQTEKNKELDNYKTQKDAQINTAITDMENTIDTYKTEKDTQINDKIKQQDTKIDSAINTQNTNIQAIAKELNYELNAAIQDQNNTIEANNQAQNKVISDAITEQNKTINTVVENDKAQDGKLDALGQYSATCMKDIKKLQDKDVAHEERMTAIEAVNVEQNNRLDAIEIKNDQQDSRLNDVEAKNKKQDLDLKCLFAESHSERITLDDEVGNSVFLQNSKQGFATVDELKGNTLVNCNKDTDKELILNGNIDTSGYTSVTTTEGVDGGKVDVALEGNTMVNVCDQEEAVAITKSYTVETGNHIALQGEYDGKCRPNIYGNTIVNIALAKDDYSYKNGKNLNNEINLVYNLKAGVTYTLIRTIADYTPGVMSNVVTFYDMSFYIDGKQAQDHNCTYNGNGVYVSKFTPTKDVTHMNIIIGMDNIDKDNGIYPTITISDYMILEGDYTNKPIPDYFTGMKSSFEDKLVPENLSSSVITNGQINKQYATLCTVDASKLKKNTTYTTFIKNDGDEDIRVYANNTAGNFNYMAFTIPAKSSKVVNISTKDAELDTTKKVCLSLAATETLPQNISVYLVEGDYTNYDFTDYDSTKAGKYKVDYKVTGKNKLNLPSTSTEWNDGRIAVTDSTTVTFTPSSAGTQGMSFMTTYTNADFKKGTQLTISATKISGANYTSGTHAIGIYFKYTNEDEPVSKVCPDFTTVHTVGTTHTITITLDKDVAQIGLYAIAWNIGGASGDSVYKVQLEEGTTATDYEPYKESIKTLYLNSPLLEGDTIEQSGNNIIHNHRYGKMNLYDRTNPSTIWNSDGAVNGVNWFWCNTLKNGDLGSYIVNNNDNNHRTFSDKIAYIKQANAINIGFPEGVLTSNDDAGVKAWIEANKPNIVYELAQPTQEIIATNDNLLLDSYTNGHLDVNTVVPIDKVEFYDTTFKLKYLYSSTSYTIQFESDNIGKIDYMYFRGSNNPSVSASIVKGLNKITLKTGDGTLGNYVQLSGIGFNASKIVVTPKVEQPFGYFKGMKSVGECEGNKIEILSRNKNLLNLNNFSKNVWGVTVTYNQGVLNINGTLSDEKDDGLCDYYLCGDWVDEIDNLKLKPNTRYTFSGNVCNYVEIYIIHNGQVLCRLDGTHNSNSFTNSSHGRINTIMVRVRKGFTFSNTTINIQIEEGNASTSIITSKSNKKEILLNEPLRGLPNGVKDKYVIIDGKWYIERNTYQTKFNTSNYLIMGISTSTWHNGYQGIYATAKNTSIPAIINTTVPGAIISDKLPNKLSIYTNDAGDVEGIGTWSDSSADIIGRFKVNTTEPNNEQTYSYINALDLNIIYQLAQPTYEPIDYNPFEVYTDITHISNNSNIPCNMVIRNSGFNCILKPNTTYTISSNNGLSTVTTKDSIGDSVLRFYDKDTSSVNTMKNVLVLEGDYITGNPPIPAFFKGMESAFEQELVTDENDKNYGKYKVNVKATNPDNSQENNITFYINEPLRGVGNIKDKVYVKEDKVVVERNCSSITLNGSDNEGSWYMQGTAHYQIAAPYNIHLKQNLGGICNKFPVGFGNEQLYIYPILQGDTSYIRLQNGVTRWKTLEQFKQWLQINPVTLIYPLATPTYEEVEYFDLKLFVEIFKDTTINYNSNIPVTSTINYTYSTPLTDAVNTVSDISDQQDSMIIDMATQVATMQMMLM